MTIRNMLSAIAALSFPLSSAAGAEEAAQPAKVVACVGDSITFGSGTTKGNAYPAQLQRMLGDGWTVRNFGVGGRTLLRKGNLPYWKEKAYQNALASKPDYVILMLGTNDTKPQNWKFESEFDRDYRDLVKSFLDLPSKPKVFACLPCPVPEPGNFGINETNVRLEIPRIEAIAKDLKLGVIDMHAALEDHPEFLPDRVHPNDDGARLMAAAAFTALTGKPAPEKKTAPEPAMAE
ncbi:MAG: hypothetical protein H7A48_07910 [Akkermansiaceae bacterium]|nr:hypothetical protein [Akkermansiaceae bacterium]